jgi:hypothetical protein
MDDDNFFDEPLTAPDGIQTFGWPVADPATDKLAAAINGLARLMKEQLQWQRNFTSNLMALSASGPTPKSTATDAPSIVFATDTELIRRARIQLSRSKKR